MIHDATLKNIPKSVEDAINSATTQSDLRELMLAAMEKSGMTVPRTRDEEFNIRLTRQAAAPPPDQALAASGYKFERTIRFHESTGRRALVIRGNSEADLNALESQILGY